MDFDLVDDKQILVLNDFFSIGKSAFFLLIDEIVVKVRAPDCTIRRHECHEVDSVVDA